MRRTPQALAAVEAPQLRCNEALRTTLALPSSLKTVANPMNFLCSSQVSLRGVTPSRRKCTSPTTSLKKYLENPKPSLPNLRNGRKRRKRRNTNCFKKKQNPGG